MLLIKQNKTLFQGRYWQLRAEYLSEVAPDRKQLYQQAKSAMKNQNTNPKCKGIGELTLLDFLEQAEGKNQNLADKQIALAGI